MTDPIEAIRAALTVEIDLTAIEEEIERRWLQTAVIDKASKLFLCGEIDGDGFFDIVEPVMADEMEQYVNEVQDNIDELEDEGWFIFPV